MANLLFTGNIIAIIWDFDQTLIRGYQQAPLFKKYDIDANVFWEEVNALSDYYRERDINVSKDTIYLNHILSYVNEGEFPNLTNKLLNEFGQSQDFYNGIPEIFVKTKEYVQNKREYVKNDIEVEHYIVSTGLRQIIKGSIINDHIDDIWANDFIEYVAKPGFKQTQEKLSISDCSISQVGYFLDNTTKTRAVWEINKGTNKDSEIGVNDLILEQDRRVPIPNMIYIADGPSDIPIFSILNLFGGKTLGVYNPDNPDHFREVKKLQDQGRVNHFCRADYREGKDAFLWIIDSLRIICDAIVENRARALVEKVKKSTKHITN